MLKSATRLIAALVAMGAIGAVYLASTKEPAQKQGAAGGGKRGGGGAGADLPVPVTGAEAKLADVPVFLEGVGTARALNSVMVRPQIDGKLLKLHFRDGQTVTKGELLADLDATTYKAQFDQVVAKRVLTETQLANARKDSERYARIPGVVAQKTVDTQIAQVAQFEAQIKSDDAAIANARAILDYTQITAPLTGRTGIRMVDEGNIVRASGDTGIVSITQVQPISVLFTLPQQQLQTVNRSQATVAIRVEAIDADGKTVLDTGVLQVVDNQVDQTTGTVKMKAEFANANLQLWPGQFVNVRLLVNTLKQVVVVPTPAVQRGPNGTFVYVADAESRARSRPIELTLQTDTESVVKNGLAPGDRVVTSGFARLQDSARLVFGRQGGEAAKDRAGEAAKDRAGEAAAKDAPTGVPAASTGAPKPGGVDAAAAGEQFRQVCGPDLQTHCAGIARDGLRQCIAANSAKFSAPCQAAVAAREADRQRDAGGKGDGSGPGGGKGGKRGQPPADANAAPPAQAPSKTVSPAAPSPATSVVK